MTTSATTSATSAPPAAPRTAVSFIREIVVLLFVALMLALGIKALFVQAFFIPSGSMEQTLRVHDRVLVNKVVYHFRDIHRGEIVVFNGLDSFQPETHVEPAHGVVAKFQRKFAAAIGLGQPGEQDFIKRVIGVPGDVVACCKAGKVTVNGQALDEPYLYDDDHQTFGPVKVEPGKLFVMGDHRGNSGDSRLHGTVPQDKVIGRAFVVIWPVPHVKGLRVPKTFAASAMTPPALGLAGALPVGMVRLRRRRRRRTAGA